jgi:hypothetical protein
MLASVASGKNVRVITNDQMRDHAFQVKELKSKREAGGKQQMLVNTL